MSAFSIITALLFNYDQTKYTTLSSKNEYDADLALSPSQHSSSSLDSSLSADGDDILESFIQNYYESPLITAESKPKIKITFEKKGNNVF